MVNAHLKAKYPHYWRKFKNRKTFHWTYFDANKIDSDIFVMDKSTLIPENYNGQERDYNRPGQMVIY